MNKAARNVQFKAHVKRLLREFGFIKNLNTVVQEELAGIVLHESRKAGEVLWKAGDPPDDGCYVILTGEVQIWKSEEKAQDDLKKGIEHDMGSQALQRHAYVILNLLEDEKEDEDEAHKEAARRHQRRAGKKKPQDLGWDTSPELHVRTLGVGVMFGEVALLEDKPRFGTFKCKTDCEFLRIKKNDFERLLKTSMNQIRSKQLSGPMRAFLREFDFFKKLDGRVKIRVPDIMQYQRYRAGALIFREGDPPSHCYIVLNGVVTIHKEDVDTTSDNASNKARNWSEQPFGMQIKAAAMLHRLHEREDYTHAYNWVDSAEKADVNSIGGVLAKLGAASIFGELALMDDTCRTASVVCETECEFLSVEKEDFNKLIKWAIADTHTAVPELVQPLLNEVPFFAAFRPAVRENVAYCMRYYVEQKGQVLFWEGDPPGNCYLLLEGEVSVWKKQGDDTMAVSREKPLITADKHVMETCDVLANRLAGLNKPMHLDEMGPAIRDLIAKNKANVEAVQEQMGQRRHITRCETSSNIVDVLGLQVARLGQGCVFGEAALMENKHRNATVTCENTCHILVINRPDFDRVVKQDLLRVKVKQLAGSIKRLLREFDLFKELSPHVQDQLADIIHYWKAREGTLLFEQGDQPNYCYIILSGEVTIWKKRAIAEPVRVAQAQDGGPEEAVEEPGDMAGNRRNTGLAPSYQKRPPVELASEVAREKCTSLAHMLASAADHGMSTLSGDAQGRHTEDDAMVRYTCDPVAALGSGTLFGELGLLNDQPRGATSSCWKDCEFLLIEKEDFDRLLKNELNRTKEEKLKFLRTHVPGVRTLQPSIAERLLYYFNKETVPRNHVFIKQGAILQGDIYFVWEGSVESYANLPRGAFLRRGILLRGSIFAAIPLGSPAPFTVVATSSPCEVLHVKPEFRKHIPESVLSSVREIMEQTLVRRNGQCTPLIPVLPDVNKLQSLPRPSSQPTGKDARRRKTCLMPLTQDLFQRVKTDVDFKVFQLTPGETVAMKAQRPKQREKKPGVHGMTISASAPSLGANSLVSMAPLLSH
jgi:CRP-like cAMP-binding protein